MNKLFIFSLLFLLSLTSVSAVLTDAVRYYSSDDADTSGTISIDASGTSNATIVGGPTTGVTSPVLNQVYRYAGDPADYLDTNVNLDLSADWTVTMWVNFTASYDSYVPLFGDASEGCAFLNSGGFPTEDFRCYVDGINKIASTISLDSGTTYFIAVVYNATGYQFWVNNSLLEFVADTGDTLTVDRLGATGLFTSRSLKGEMDEVGIWTRALSESEMGQLWNGGAGFNPFAATNPPTVTVDYPRNNTHFRVNNVSFVFNYSSDGEYTGTCELFINNVSVAINNSVTHNTRVNLTSNVTYADGVYSGYVTCNDSLGFTNSSVRTFVVDTIFPVITWTVPTNNNHTNYTNSTNTFNLDINLTDTYLFSYNLTIRDINGTVIQHSEATNLTVSNFTIQDLVNLSNSSYSFGTYYVNVTVADDHTAGLINSYQVNKNVLSRTLNFLTDTGTNISLFLASPVTTLQDIGYEKLDDRYIFNFEYAGLGNAVFNYTFLLRSDKKLFDRKGLYPYPSFVTGKNWFDFNLCNTTAKSTNVEKIDDYSAYVTVETRARDLNFCSTGGLNFVTQSAVFNYESTNPTYLSIVSTLPAEFNNLTLTTIDEWVAAGSLLFNLTDSHNFTFMNSQSIERLSGGTDIRVQLRFILDGSIIDEETLRTISSNDVGVAGFNPITQELGFGSHNATLQYRFIDASANVLIRDIDLVGYAHRTNDDNYLAFREYNSTGTHSSSSGYQEIQALDFSSLSSIGWVFGKFKTSKTAGGNREVYYKFQNDGIGTNSSVSARWISAPNNIGNIGLGSLSWSNGNNGNLGFYGLVEAPSQTIDVNYTLMGTSLVYNGANITHYVGLSDSRSDADNDISIVAGTTNLVNHSFKMLNGTEMLVKYEVSLQSTSGSQTVRVDITGENISCVTGKSRYFSGSTDIGNIYGVHLCNVTGSGGRIDLGVTLSAGETADVIDESLSLVEAVPVPSSVQAGFNASGVNTTITIVLDTPANNTNVSSLTPTFTFNYSQGQGIAGNCTLFINEVDAGTVNCTSDSKTTVVSNQTLLNLTSYDWFVRARVSNNETNSSRQNFTVSIAASGDTDASGSSGSGSVEIAMVLSFFIIIWLLFRVGSDLDGSKNTFVQGAKLGLYGFSYTLALLALNLGRQIAEANTQSEDIIAMFTTAWQVSIALTIAVVAALAMWSIWKIIKMWIDIRG